MTLGIIGRHDAGGLGTLTSEVFRHLKPERTLLLSLGSAGRGDGNLSLYDLDGAGRSVYPADWGGKLAARHIDWLCAEGIDTLWSAETFYDEEVLRRAHQNGIRTVCYVMPELSPWNPSAPIGFTGPPLRPRELHTPTSWMLGRTGDEANVRVVPFPIARDRLPWKLRAHHDRPLHLYHVVGAAMLDRNGTELLLTALTHTTVPLRVTIRTEKGARELTYHGNGLDLTQVTDRALNYWETYPHDADVLVLPRRYGGLSLPIQEAASLGMPSIVLDSDPYAIEWFTAAVESKVGTTARMKGGEFPVQDADPRAIASTIDMLSRNRDLVRSMSRAADEWAAQRDWSGPLGDRWATMLR